MPTFPQYISGKTVVNSPFSASSDRYSFLSLENAEPNLGAPVGAPGFYALLSDPVSGIRVWGNLTALSSEPYAGQDTQIIFSSAGKLVGSNALLFNYTLSSIVAGCNSVNSFGNTFTFGSYITAGAPDFTYVNNLSTPGSIYGELGQFDQFYVTDGYSGFGTLSPNEKVTIVGNLSVTDTIYGRISAEALPPRIAQDTQVIFNSGGTLAGLSALSFLYTLSGLRVGYQTCLTFDSLYSGVLGGSRNLVWGCYSSVTMGESNSARACYASIVGGNNNLTCGLQSFIGGGTCNTILNNNTVIGGGQNNCVTGVQGALLGGRDNQITSDYSVVGGGYENCARDTYSIVGGGYSNEIGTGGVWSFIGGGENNYTTGSTSVIAGGRVNCVTANCAGILGGTSNCVTHANSFIVGSNLKSAAVCTTFVNNLSAPGIVCSHDMFANTISANNLAFTQSTISTTATATDAFITLIVGGSSLALPLFKIN